MEMRGKGKGKEGEEEWRRGERRGRRGWDGRGGGEMGNGVTPPPHLQLIARFYDG